MDDSDEINIGDLIYDWEDLGIIIDKTPHEYKVHWIYPPTEAINRNYHEDHMWLSHNLTRLFKSYLKDIINERQKE